VQQRIARNENPGLAAEKFRVHAFRIHAK